MEPVLNVSNLNFSYPESEDLLTGISIDLYPGEKLALIGPNGSGKTTLFLLICGILKASSGDVSVKGKSIKHGKFNPDIGYLFQSPDDQLFSSTIFDDVAFGPLNMGRDKEEAIGAAEEILKRCGSLHLAGRSPHHLSGGEKRMCAIASVLVMEPSVILFDEPTSNLDSRNRRNLINMIQGMEESLIISSHDLEFLLETCSGVLLLDEGKIITTGDIRSVMADEALMSRHGLEKPHSLVPHHHY